MGKPSYKDARKDLLKRVTLCSNVGKDRMVEIDVSVARDWVKALVKYEHNGQING